MPHLTTGDAARTTINAMRDNLDAMHKLKMDPPTSAKSMTS